MLYDGVNDQQNETRDLNPNDLRCYNEFVIEISDNGSGISKEGLKNLFIDFSSLQEHRKQNQRGTGLGLSICKKIIEMMGGDVKVSSTLGKGTTFSISLTCLCKISKSKIIGGKKDRKKDPNNIVIDSLDSSSRDNEQGG